MASCYQCLRRAAGDPRCDCLCTCDAYICEECAAEVLRNFDCPLCNVYREERVGQIDLAGYLAVLKALKRFKRILGSGHGV